MDEISDSRDIVTVDLGFNGSINKNLENVFSKCSVTHSAIHLLAFGSEKTLELKLKNIDIRSFFQVFPYFFFRNLNQDMLNPIQRSSFPIEQLFFMGQ